jgi:hypothetical protein
VDDSAPAVPGDYICLCIFCCDVRQDALYMVNIIPEQYQKWLALSACPKIS